MAADPTLADRIKRAEANLDSLHSDLHDQECLMPLQDQWLTEARTAMEAAAVRLRKLDAAISNVRAEFGQALSDDAETSGFLTWIERLDTVLADALGGTE